MQYYCFLAPAGPHASLPCTLPDVLSAASAWVLPHGCASGAHQHVPGGQEEEAGAQERAEEVGYQHTWSASLRGQSTRDGLSLHFYTHRHSYLLNGE